MKQITLLLLLTLLIACAPTIVLEGQAPVEVARPVSVPADAELMVVRPGGNANSEASISQIYNLTTNTLLYDLPAGRSDVDNTIHFTTYTEGVYTKIAGIQLNTGKTTKNFQIEGKWGLAGLSPNGLWLAMAQRSTDLTNIKILNATTGEETHTIALDGEFEVEAISTTGQFLYLIHHLSHDTYQVRLYDLRINELAPDPLRDKRIQDEFMTGYAWGTTMSQQGDWLLTLYMNQKRNTAFIHALNLDNGFTLCLALPSDGGDFDTLQQYTLTLSPSGNTIYAANAALGKLKIISLLNFEAQTVIDFEPATDSSLSATTMQTSLLTPDGNTLYFALDNQLWAYDTQAQMISEAINTPATLSGMAFNADENSLHLAYVNETVETMTTTTFNFLIPVARK